VKVIDPKSTARMASAAGVGEELACGLGFGDAGGGVGVHPVRSAATSSAMTKTESPRLMLAG
jgi:hypothetical protein